MKEQELIKRTREAWSEYAGEKINIHLPNHDMSVIYAVGSELACLRLYKRFNTIENIEKIEVNYSENLETWFFKLEH